MGMNKIEIGTRVKDLGNCDHGTVRDSALQARALGQLPRVLVSVKWDRDGRVEWVPRENIAPIRPR